MPGRTILICSLAYYRLMGLGDGIEATVKEYYKD